MSSTTATILIVDDEKNALASVSQGLKLEGYTSLTASSGEEAVEVCASEAVDLVLLDIIMPGGMNGIETLTKLRQAQPDLNVVMMSAQKEIGTAVKAMELGARNYLEKPKTVSEILLAVSPYLELSRLSRENEVLKSQIGDKDEMIGAGGTTQQLRSQIGQVASSDLSVLITGENGTGKQLVADGIHQQSQRNRKPFISLNCAALPDELIESELFGHERGAFTGAAHQRRGKFELADGGTLFLDEIGDMSLKAQAKVLRVLEYGEIQRLGGSQTLHVDVRVIAATNKDLEKEIGDGTFRQDLYYRLNVVPIYVPPLRNRQDDLPQLVQYFVLRFHRDNARSTKTIDPSAIRVMQSYDWPGNIRELKNIVERLLIMVPRDVITANDVTAVLPVTREVVAQIDSMSINLQPQSNSSLQKMVDEAEKNLVLQALEDNRWNVKQTAEQLKIERSNFYKKLAKYNIKRPDDEPYSE
ncbi:MAG: sigma-54 dependent transcriptional regulator [Candidatus Poribacteria bacterium]|nr:sigma-54 dependent transcriptional regulator [Candidatus Poribacteria bacterium]MDE0502664.1 sigma-54 dependent transcriptional regulator [Candidatus Poribacteria bacterium]